MNINKIQAASALYQSVGRYTSPKRAQTIIKDNSAVFITISQEAKAMQEAAEKARIEQDIRNEIEKADSK